MACASYQHDNTHACRHICSIGLITPRKTVVSILHAYILLENEKKVCFTSCFLTFLILSSVPVASLIVGPLCVWYLFYSFNIQFPITEIFPPRQNFINTDIKYILAWCDYYGNYKYDWEFGEKKFRFISFE